MLFGAPHPMGDEVFQWKASGPLMVCRTVGLAYLGSSPPAWSGRWVSPAVFVPADGATLRGSCAGQIP